MPPAGRLAEIHGPRRAGAAAPFGTTADFQTEGRRSQQFGDTAQPCSRLVGKKHGLRTGRGPTPLRRRNPDSRGYVNFERGGLRAQQRRRWWTPGHPNPPVGAGSNDAKRRRVDHTIISSTSPRPFVLRDAFRPALGPERKQFDRGTAARTRNRSSRRRGMRQTRLPEPKVSLVRLQGIQLLPARAAAALLKDGW